MPTTRRQAAIAQGTVTESEGLPKKRSRSMKKAMGKAEKEDESHANVGEKRPAPEAESSRDTEKDNPPNKKVKAQSVSSDQSAVYHPGTIERGHVYFFYRPRVQVEEVQAIDEIRTFHMLLVPRPPAFSEAAEPPSNGKVDPAVGEGAEMQVLEPGADAAPAFPQETSMKHYRLITVGKKRLPDSTKESGRRDTLWATVTAVGDDLESLEKGLSEEEYETKTRGTRHEGPARLVGRGAYAFVNTEAATPSKRSTYFGYHLSHPSPSDMGDVQNSLGILTAASFHVQVKNPKTPANNPAQAHTKGAEYPTWIMQEVFGSAKDNADNVKGIQDYGLRFASVETPELLDYQGSEILLIGARAGEEGLETSLGEGRGSALKETEDQEAGASIHQVFNELGFDLHKFPAEPLGGQWI